MSTIRGQFAAEHVIAQIKTGHAAPGALADAWAAAADEPGAAQGFARAVQKALERSASGGRGVRT
jgi:hypothetical protein